MSANVTSPPRYAPRGQSADRYPATAALRARYDAYRRGQGRDLLGLIPRGGVRVLYARMLEGAADVTLETGDPLERLATFCAELLPLPTFEVWLQDFHQHRTAHLALAAHPLADGPAGPAGEPVTVEVRSLRFGADEWVAALAVRPVEDEWRGAIHFHRPPEDRRVRTADIFREPCAHAVRERFSSFDENTLRAFLRSALP